uniref:Uncharacterized protein n=1 Tax=Arion vulgaris TaxID=1028688 RepID=A0A0B7ANL5_9EUPU
MHFCSHPCHIDCLSFFSSIKHECFHPKSTRSNTILYCLHIPELSVKSASRDTINQATHKDSRICGSAQMKMIKHI